MSEKSNFWISSVGIQMGTVIDFEKNVILAVQSVGRFTDKTLTDIQCKQTKLLLSIFSPIKMQYNSKRKFCHES